MLHSSLVEHLPMGLAAVTGPGWRPRFDVVCGSTAAAGHSKQSHWARQARERRSDLAAHPWHQRWGSLTSLFTNVLSQSLAVAVCRTVLKMSGSQQWGVQVAPQDANLLPDVFVWAFYFSC